LFLNIAGCLAHNNISGAEADLVIAACRVLTECSILAGYLLSSAAFLGVFVLQQIHRTVSWLLQALATASSKEDRAITLTFHILRRAVDHFELAPGLEFVWRVAIGTDKRDFGGNLCRATAICFRAHNELQIRVATNGAQSHGEAGAIVEKIKSFRASCHGL
jgi:hypothetical protein